MLLTFELVLMDEGTRIRSAQIDFIGLHRFYRTILTLLNHYHGKRKTKFLSEVSLLY